MLAVWLSPPRQRILTSPASAYVLHRCVDSPAYVPPVVSGRSWPCTTWAAFDCNTATAWGYTPAQQAELIAGCPLSCGTCTAANALDEKLDKLHKKLSATATALKP